MQANNIPKCIVENISKTSKFLDMVAMTLYLGYTSEKLLLDIFAELVSIIQYKTGYLSTITQDQQPTVNC